MSVKITSEIESEIIKLIETKSQKEIAFLYKISKSSVGNIIRKNNIKVNKGRLNMARLPLDVDLNI